MLSELRYVPFMDFYLISKADNRVSKDGYQIKRFLASVDVVDHQNDIVDIPALLEVQETMLKQGGRIQGFHTNYPGGRFTDYGLVKIKDTNNNEAIGLWVDVEIFDDYPSQQDMKRKVNLPIGHPDRINGLSLGGKSLRQSKVCDANTCWNRLEKIEGWEYSFVDQPANPLALQIESYDVNNMGDLVINTTFDNIYNTEVLTVTEAQKILKSRDKTGRFSKKEDCETCPPKDVSKMEEKPKEEEEKMDKPEADNEMATEQPSDTDPEESNETFGGDIEEKMDEEESMEGEEEAGYQPMGDASMNEPYSATSSSSEMQEINLKLDTIMASFNIGKEKDNGLSRLKQVVKNKKELKTMSDEEIVINGKVYVVKDEPKEIIKEIDGKKYKLVEEETTDAPIEKSNDALSKFMDDTDKKINVIAESISNLISGGLQKQYTPEKMPNSIEQPGSGNKEVSDAEFAKRFIKEKIDDTRVTREASTLTPKEIDLNTRFSIIEKGRNGGDKFDDDLYYQ